MTRRGIPFYTKADQEYRAALDMFFSDFEGDPTADSVTLDVEFHIPRYKTSSYPYPRTDIDNLLKALMDGMTRAGVFWEDDHLVTELNAMKVFSDTPGTKVKVTYHEEANSERTHH